MLLTAKSQPRHLPLATAPTTREPPVPVYLSLKVHSEIRKKELVDILHKLGLGISYKRVMSISTDIANSVCKKFHAYWVVVPPKLHPHAFTIGAVDNTDHNPSSTTARDSFHGTSISLMQDPSSASDSSHRDAPLIDRTVKSSIQELPVTYTDITPVDLAKREELVVPPTQTNV